MFTATTTAMDSIIRRSVGESQEAVLKPTKSSNLAEVMNGSHQALVEEWGRGQYAATSRKLGRTTTEEQTSNVSTMLRVVADVIKDGAIPEPTASEWDPMREALAEIGGARL